MSKKSIEDLSSEELFELAKQRAVEEQESAKEGARTRIEELREQRRELIASHKKSLAAIDREIRDLNKRLRAGSGKSGSVGGSSRSPRGGASKQIVAIIRDKGPIAVNDLKHQLETAGVETKNLNQQLAYLKRRGEIQSPQRAVYTAK